MSKKSLNPCPFCGSAAGIQKDITGEEKYHAVCNDAKCKCPMIAGMPAWSGTEEEAAELWNRRSNENSTDIV